MMAEEDPLGILTGPFTLTSLRPPDLSKCTPSEISRYFENTYSLNESIFTILKSEDTFYKCPDRLRLPLIFYYGHTASVYINKLILADLITERVNLEMETIFETGVDEMNWDDTENYRMGGSYKWPAIKDVVQFRRKVRSVIRNVIENAVFNLPVTMDSPYWALFMGMEHERIHLETSSVLIRQLPVGLVRIPPKWNQSPVNHGSDIIQNEMILVPGCKVVLGKPFDFPSYGWDNEYPQMQSYVPDFEASKFLITNGEFLEFINDGGYEKMELWSNEGWLWKLYRNAIHPTFWVCSKDCKSGCGGTLSSYSHCGNGKISIHDEVDENENIHHHSVYRLRTVCEEIKMPWLWPVEVNYHEAQAYCRWKGKGYRLLTEAEHNAIRDLRGDITEGTVTDPVFDWELHRRCNLNLAYCSSTPVNHYPPNSKGFHDVFGNVWQWTEDHFNGFPGTKTNFLYDDFSTPCFDGKHNIIMGGSWISTGDEASRFARYSFRRHFFQHAGFRLARSRGSPNDIPLRLVKCSKGPKYEISCQVDDLSSKFVESTNYQFHDESEEALKKQLMNEYWPAGQNNFYSQLFQLCRKYAKQFIIPARRALDINTGCGRMTFELCRDFSQVVGTDFSESFLHVCHELQEHGSKCLTIQKQSESSDIISHVVKVPDDIDPKRATFKQMTWVPLELCNFDLVVMHSLHRLTNKKAWIMRMQGVINRGGLLIISSKEPSLQESQLQKMLGHRLKCVESQEIVQNSTEEQLEVSSFTVTAWMHV